MDKFLGLLISIHAINPTTVWEAQRLVENLASEVTGLLSQLIVIPL
jgi:hypothetical protein